MVLLDLMGFCNFPAQLDQNVKVQHNIIRSQEPVRTVPAVGKLLLPSSNDSTGERDSLEKSAQRRHSSPLYFILQILLAALARHSTNTYNNLIGNLNMNEHLVVSYFN